MTIASPIAIFVRSPPIELTARRKVQLLNEDAIPTRDPKRNGYMTALGDGSVPFFKKTIKEKTLRLLVQRDDGMPIPVDDE